MSIPLFPYYFDSLSVPEVHTLVAFAAEYISRSSGLPPITPHAWYAGRNDKPDVADAIAALCVTPAHTQSVAVAVTLDAEMHKVELLICQGGVEDPDKQLLAHVRKTWNLLRAIVEQKGAAREEAELRLFRYVYQFQEYEILRIVQESWPKVELANRQLGRAIRREMGGYDRMLKRRFQRAATSLRLAVQLMGDDLGALTTADWKKVKALMAKACQQANPVLRQWNRADEWGVSFAGKCRCHRCTSSYLLIDLDRYRAPWAVPRAIGPPADSPTPATPHQSVLIRAQFGLVHLLRLHAADLLPHVSFASGGSRHSHAALHLRRSKATHQKRLADPQRHDPAGRGPTRGL